MAAPSVITGFRLAARLHRLVAAVWLAWVAIFVPALLFVQVATGPDRANRLRWIQGGGVPSAPLLCPHQEAP